MIKTGFPKHWSSLKKLMWLRGSPAGGAKWHWTTVTGNPVTLSNAVAGPLRQLKIEFSPVQDLHGYDSPWPAGGGANKLPAPTSVIETTPYTVTENNGVITISGTADEGAPIDVYIPNFTFAASGQKICLFNSFTSGIIYFYNGSTQVDYFTLSFANRVIPESSLAALQGQTIDRYRIAINPQTLSNATISLVVADSNATVNSFAPYSNECPISGWDGATVEQRGKNLLQLKGRRVVTTVSGTTRDFSEPSLYIGETPNNYHDANRVASYSVSDDSVTVNMNSASGYGLGFNVKVKPNTDYYGSYDGWETNTYTLGFYDEGGNYLGFKQWDARKFTTPDKCTNLMVVLRTFTTGTDVTFKEPYLVFGTEAVAYVPYDPASQLIQVVFPDGETYYSGWVDPISGDGMLDMGGTALAALTWSRDTTRLYPTFRPAEKISGMKQYPFGTTGVNMISSRYKCKGINYFNDFADNDNNGILAYAESGGQVGKILVQDSNYSTAEAFQTAMSDVLLVYELETPIPFHVDPQAINSLEGTNTMWTDAGPMTVEYRKDGNVSDVEALNMLLGGRYTPAQGPEDVSDAEALSIITGGNR